MLIEDFGKYLEKQENGCVEWQRGKFATGYGAVSIGGKMKLSHRVAWEIENGPIPEGLCVLHRCDNRPCCNTKHLFMGTIADNNRDMADKGRCSASKRTHCPSGHEYNKSNIKWYEGRRYCRTCQREWNKLYQRRRYAQDPERQRAASSRYRTRKKMEAN